MVHEKHGSVVQTPQAGELPSSMLLQGSERQVNCCLPKTMSIEGMKQQAIQNFIDTCISTQSAGPRIDWYCQHLHLLNVFWSPRAISFQAKNSFLQATIQRKSGTQKNQIPKRFILFIDSSDTLLPNHHQHQSLNRQSSTFSSTSSSKEPLLIHNILPTTSHHRHHASLNSHDPHRHNPRRRPRSSRDLRCNLLSQLRKCCPSKNRRLLSRSVSSPTSFLCLTLQESSHPLNPASQIFSQATPEHNTLR